MNRVVRNNLRVRHGDLIQIHSCPDIPNGKRIHILPFEDCLEGVDREFLTRNLVLGYFKDCYRPLHKGDTFIVRGNFLAVEYMVMEVDPGEMCLVTPNTVIFDEGDPVSREDQEKMDGISYDDIGGCRKQMA